MHKQEANLDEPGEEEDESDEVENGDVGGHAVETVVKHIDLQFSIISINNLHKKHTQPSSDAAK